MDRVTITKATLYELGPVTNPAYTQTSAKLRSSEKAIGKQQLTNNVPRM